MNAQGKVCAPGPTHPGADFKASVNDVSPSQPRISYADAVRKTADRR